jgi:hypothetical protein
VANGSGTATITVTVNDGQSQNNTVTRTFTVTVNPVNDAPTITNPVGGLPPTQSISENQTLTLTFDIADVETPANLLGLTTARDNANLVPGSGIALKTTATNANSVAAQAKIPP